MPVFVKTVCLLLLIMPILIHWVLDLLLVIANTIFQNIIKISFDNIAHLNCW